MTYNVFSGTLNPTHFTSPLVDLLLQSVTDLMITERHVVVTALNFSKPFDVVRHNALLSKTALLNIPDPIYNWLQWISLSTVSTAWHFVGQHRRCWKSWLVQSKVPQLVQCPVSSTCWTCPLQYQETIVESRLWRWRLVNSTWDAN